jgi:hypothetical protein
METPDLEQPAWQAAIGTVLSYGVVLVGMTILLFLLPYLLFTSL